MRSLCKSYFYRIPPNVFHNFGILFIIANSSFVIFVQPEFAPNNFFTSINYSSNGLLKLLHAIGQRLNWQINQMDMIWHDNIFSDQPDLAFPQSVNGTNRNFCIFWFFKVFFLLVTSGCHKDRISFIIWMK